MLKIIIIYPGFPHYRDGIIETLIESKNHSYIFAGDKKGYNNIKPYKFDCRECLFDFPAYSIGPFYFNRGLITFVVKNKFDGAIVHSSPYWISIILATIILRLKGNKVYNWTHGILSNRNNLKNKFYYLFYKFFFDGLLLYGNNAKNNIVRFGYSNEKAKVIYNSLNYKKQMKLRDTLSDSKRKKIRNDLFVEPQNEQLLFIGRLTPQKKLHLLIEAIKLLKEENIIVNLLFVGEGSERKKLQYQIDEFGINNQICFYGASYDEVTNYELIASSDCCVAPGEIGLTAMHALMFGVPVISHNDANKQMPEYEAILPNINGEFFEYDSAVDLKEKIKKVLNSKTKKGANQMKKDCYKIMDDFYNPNFQLSLIENLFPN